MDRRGHETTERKRPRGGVGGPGRDKSDGVGLSPVKAFLRGGFPVFAAIGAAFSLYLARQDPLGGLLLGIIIIGMPSMGELTACLRITHALERFAAQVPGRPEVRITWGAKQELEWPEHRICVSCRTHMLAPRPLSVRAGEEVWFPSLRQAEEAGKEAWRRVARRR